LQKRSVHNRRSFASEKGKKGPSAESGKERKNALMESGVATPFKAAGRKNLRWPGGKKDRGINNGLNTALAIGKSELLAPRRESWERDLFTTKLNKLRE